MSEGVVAAPVPGTDSKSNGVFIILFITRELEVHTVIHHKIQI